MVTVKITTEERKYGNNLLKEWAQISRDIEFFHNKAKDITEKINMTNDFDINMTLNEVLNELECNMKRRLNDYYIIEMVLAELPPIQQNIIIYKYKRKFTWEKTAQSVYHSVRECHYIRNMVIKKILIKQQLYLENKPEQSVIY